MRRALWDPPGPQLSFLAFWLILYSMTSHGQKGTSSNSPTARQTAEAIVKDWAWKHSITRTTTLYAVEELITAIAGAIYDAARGNSGTDNRVHRDPATKDRREQDPGSA